MKPDYDSLINAGLSKEEIAKISGCEDQGMQIRMLRKYRYKLLDEVHEKQQSLDARCGRTYRKWSERRHLRNRS